MESGRHTLCLPTQATTNGPCAPTTDENAPFEQNTRGLIFRVGDTAMSANEGEDHELTYLLLPMIENLWAKRDQTDEGELFAGSFVFRAPDGRPGDGIVMPTAFAAESSDASGNLPFSYSAIPETTKGAWFVDPAFVVGQLLSFPEPFSTTYCFNPFFAIDERDSNENCSD